MVAKTVLSTESMPLKENEKLSSISKEFHTRKNIVYIAEDKLHAFVILSQRLVWASQTNKRDNWNPKKNISGYVNPKLHSEYTSLWPCPSAQRRSEYTGMRIRVSLTLLKLERVLWLRDTFSKIIHARIFSFFDFKMYDPNSRVLLQCIAL